jgi:hypothetical protein
MVALRSVANTTPLVQIIPMVVVPLYCLSSIKIPLEIDTKLVNRIFSSFIYNPFPVTPQMFLKRFPALCSSDGEKTALPEYPKHVTR